MVTKKRPHDEKHHQSIKISYKVSITSEINVLNLKKRYLLVRLKQKYKKGKTDMLGELLHFCGFLKMFYVLTFITIEMVTRIGMN